jgi:2-polyprenyl-3-methyl-5-hydroxy-6-metoxy-1,4-benzoquinol methylase
MLRASRLSFYVFNLRLGQGTDYTRYFEYPKALEMLAIGDVERLSVLDVGSGRRGQFPLFLAAKFPQLSVCSSDPREDFGEQKESVKKLGLQAALNSGRLRLEAMDIQSPIFPDETFDRVSCISTVEHIPEEGDSTAMRNMGRLLKPMGLLVLSVPFNSYRNGEIYRRERAYPVPQRQGSNAVSLRRHFFERVYDEESLNRRIIGPSGLELEQIVYFGEPGFSFGRFMHHGFRKKGVLATLLFASRLVHLSIPLTSSLFLRQIEAQAFDAEDWSGVGVLLSLRKTGRRHEERVSALERFEAPGGVNGAASAR